MKLDTYFKKKNEGESQLQPEPKEKLAAIINNPLTPENINTYFDDALNEVAELASSVRHTYGQIRRHPRMTTAQVEDRAFSYFDLGSIPEILKLIDKKNDEMNEVNEWLRSNTEILPAVFIPPDQRRPGIVPGSGTFERPDVLNRLRTLLYILKDEGIDLNATRMRKGQLDDSMMRKTSYVSVEIPALDRMVLVCDEEGNISYMFDLPAMSRISRSLDELVHVGKDELNKLLKENPGLGVRFAYSSGWTERVREFLYDNLTQRENKKSKRKETTPLITNIPAVSNMELDPWRKFYSADDGKHYGTITAITERLRDKHKASIAADTIESCIQKLGLVQKPVYQRSRLRDAYSYEDILPAVRDMLTTSQVAAEGEWKGFYQQGNEHFGSITAIERLLGIYGGSIQRKIKELHIAPVHLRDAQGKKIDGYPYERIGAAFEDLLALTRSETSGEWMGFYEEGSQHYGSVKAIERRLGSEQLAASRLLVLRLIRDNEISPKQILSAGGEQVEAYSYETIRQLVEPLLSLPMAEKDGEWKGFVESRGKHFAGPHIIANKLGISQKPLKERADALGLGSIRMRDQAGQEVKTAYAIEDLQAAFKEILDLPKVESSGPWKNFYIQGEKHYGNATNIAEKLGFSARFVVLKIQSSSLTPVQVRAISGNMKMAAYALEDVAEILKEQLDYPRAETDGPWRGFYIQDDTHYAGSNTIAEHLSISPKYLRDRVKNLRSITIRGKGSLVTTAYALEDVERLLADET